MDQLRAVLNQVGGDAKEMQQAMSLAFKQIVVGFIDVGKALGTFVAGAFRDTAASMLSFIGNATGITEALDSVRYRLWWMSKDTNTVTASIGKFGYELMNTLSAGGLKVFTYGVAALGAASILAVASLYQLSKEQTSVAQANAQFGGSFGASTEEVLAFNKELSALGVSSSKSAELFIEVAKAGGITKEMFVDVSTAANDFEKYVGGKAADAVKQFAEVIKDPIKTLTDFGIQTGFVSKEQVDMVKNLLETGQGLKAQELATKILKQGYASMADESKAKMSSLDLVLIEVGSSLSSLWDNFKNSETVGKVFKTFWQTIAVIGSEVWFTLKAVGIEIGGIGAQIAAVMRGDFSGAKTIGEQMTQDAEAAAGSQKALVKRILEGAGISAQVSAETKQQNSQELDGLKRKKELNEYLQKGDKDNLTRQEYQTKQVEEWNKKLGVAVMTEKEILAVRQKAGQEWDKSHKQKKDTIESFYKSSMKTLTADLNAATGAQEKYTKAQIDLLNIQSNPEWKKLTNDQKQSIVLKAEQAIAAEKLVIAQKEELRVQLELQKVWDATVKARAAQDKVDFDLLDTTMALVQSGQAENEMLVLQASLIGATDEVRKKSIKLKEIDIKYEKELAKIKAGTASDDAKKTAISDLAKWKEQEEKNVNTLIANDAAEKLLAEYNRIRDGITDSIVTALFEGGKAGSKKLRDLIVAELKKPITIVVKALVDTVMGSITGGAGGIGSALSAGSNITNALGLTSNTGLLAGLFGSAGSYGAAIGGASVAGSQAAMLAAQTAEFGAAGLAATAEAAGGAFAGLAGAANKAIAALGQIPGWGWALAGVGMLLAGLDDSGTYHTGGGATYSAANGTTASQIGFTLKEADISQSAVDFAKQFTTAIGTMLDDTAKVFGKTAGYEISTAFADDTSKDGSWGSLVIKKSGKTLIDWANSQTSKWAPKEFANGEEGKKQYIAAVAKDVRDTLIAEVPDWADTMLDALGDAPSIEGLTQTVISINQTQLAFETMGKASAGFANMTDATTAALIKASGGAAQLVASLSSYYSNFYTEEERKVLETNRLYSEFSKLNKVMPTTRQGFRDMMEAAIKAGDTTLVAELLKLSPAFASVTEATKDATEATKDAILAAKEHTESLLKNYDATKSATDEALRIAKEVINREKDKAVAALASAEAVKSALQSVFDTIKSNIRELYAEVTSTSSMQLSEARAIINEARLTGRINDNAAFTESVSTVRSSFANTNYSSKFESDKARLQFAAELSAIALVTDVQLSAAEQQIQLLKDQILQFDNLILHLDTQLKVLRGIETTNLSIDQALTKLLAVAEAEWAARAAAGLPTNLPSNPAPAPSVPSASDGFVVGGNTSGNNQQPTRGDYGDYHEVTGAFAWEYAKSLQWGGAEDASSTAALADFARNNNLSQTDLAGILGFTPDQIQSHFNQYGIPAFKSGGLHSGGMRLVGEETPELEITGPARYMNASQMYDMMANGSSSGNSDVVNEISLLRYEVRAVVNNTHKLQKLVDNMTTDTNEGVSLRTTQVV